MALITAADVVSVYPEAGKAKVDLTGFINTADLLITEELSNVRPALSVLRLTQIEKYLAAHYCCVAIERGGLTRQRVGESEDFYQGFSNKEISLSSTRFGQQAVILDTSGRLGEIS